MIIWISLVLVHLLVCIAVWLIKQKNRIKERIPFVFIVCMPVAGVLMWLAEKTILTDDKRHARKLMLEKLRVTDAKYRRLQVEQGSSENAVVPLEEALIINDTKLRRRLMLDVLHKNPEEYLELLHKASGSSDVEITHYATTTLLEIQSEYELKIQKCMNAYHQDSDNTRKLLEYRDVLTSYVESGLISGSILKMQQICLLEVLEKCLERMPKTKQDVYLSIETALNLEDYELAGRRLQEAASFCDTDEKWYQLRVRYEWERGTGSNITEIFKQMQEKKVYLSRQGKEWYSFWRKGFEDEI